LRVQLHTPLRRTNEPSDRGSWPSPCLLTMRPTHWMSFDFVAISSETTRSLVLALSRPRQTCSSFYSSFRSETSVFAACTIWFERRLQSVNI
jgi:hypothetical protein